MLVFENSFRCVHFTLNSFDRNINIIIGWRKYLMHNSMLSEGIFCNKQIISYSYWSGIINKSSYQFFPNEVSTSKHIDISLKSVCLMISRLFANDVVIITYYCKTIQFVEQINFWKLWYGKENIPSSCFSLNY